MLLFALLAALGAGLPVAAARAGSPIEEFSALPSTSQAGGHPNISVTASFGTHKSQGYPSECFCEDAKDVKISLPAGVGGNPQSTPHCTNSDFVSSECSPDTQVGVAAVNIVESVFHVPIYNVDPGPGHAALLGIFAPLVNAPLFVDVSVRTGSDYGLDANLAGLEHIFPPQAVALTLWGVPADPSNDLERAPIGGGHCGSEDWPCFEPLASTDEAIPFITNPTTCGEAPLSSRLEILAYDNETTTAEAPWPPTTGCDQLAFDPNLTVKPTTSSTDSPSGLDVELGVAQPVSATALSTSEMRAFTISLPNGLSINPGGFDGKSLCSESAARFGTTEAARCPEDSKVGTLSLTTAALPAPLPGYIYLGEPLSGGRYRLILAADGFSTHIKLAGTVEPNQATGQLAVSLQDLPQIPFSNFALHLFGGDDGILATPTECGGYAVDGTFGPWDEALPEQRSSQSFTLGAGPGSSACPGPVRPLLPSLEAGVLDATAGVHSPFFFKLSRPDGNQGLAGLTVTGPPGLLATLKGVSLCGLAEPPEPDCPAASEVGSATLAAGAGNHPIHLPAKIYLSGPYKGAPLSLAVIAPAVAGPYDLGKLVIRAALRVDPATAQITVVSDPLPQIVQGVPLRLRSILVELDRPGFMLSPTNCDPFSVGAEVLGDQGTIASPSVRFQLAGCRRLHFAPGLVLGMSGGTARRAHPTLRAVFLRRNTHESNLARVSVALPQSIRLDNARVDTPCSKSMLAARECPASSILGFARLETPLLDDPLAGPVYLATGQGAKLPELVADLDGQIGISIDGRIDTDRAGRLRAIFSGIPDAPFSRLSLRLSGGRKGLLVNGVDFCKTRRVALARSFGQNGRLLIQHVKVAAAC